MCGCVGKEKRTEKKYKVEREMGLRSEISLKARFELSLSRECDIATLAEVSSLLIVSPGATRGFIWHFLSFFSSVSMKIGSSSISQTNQNLGRKWQVVSLVTAWCVGRAYLPLNSSDIIGRRKRPQSPSCSPLAYDSKQILNLQRTNSTISCFVSCFVSLPAGSSALERPL